MLKTKGAAIFNTHERPIKICMHKTEGLKRQALKGMFSLMYITNSLLKNKRMLAYYIKACVFFTQNIQNEGLTQSLQSYWEKSWLWCWYAVAVANRLFKLHKKSVHMAYLVMRWFCVWLQSSACYYLFTQTHSVKPKPMGTMGSKPF